MKGGYLRMYTEEQISKFNRFVDISFEYEYYFKGCMTETGLLQESEEPHDKNYNAYNVSVNLTKTGENYVLGFGVTNKNIDDYSKILLDKFIELNFDEKAIADYLQKEGFENY